MTEIRQQALYIEPSRVQMGELAAAHIAAEIRRRLAGQECVRMIFAAAPSQSEMLDALAKEPAIDWSRVEAFHMDEYIGLPDDAVQNFRNWLRRSFFDRVPLGRVFLLEPGNEPEICAVAYAKLIAVRPIDIVCLGIGINGHLAFNDPPADFNDPLDVKIVELEEQSRRQQVMDALFSTLEEVPCRAVTLTVPRLLRAERLFCCVPGKIKEAAVTSALTGAISPDFPASILRTHPDCAIYLDEEAAAGIMQRSRVEEEPNHAISHRPRS